MWIADMDFKAPDEVVETVVERAKHGVYGYIGATSGMGYYVKLYSDFGLFPRVWMGFIFMVIILVVVMTIFEKVKVRLLRWTIN